jgi:hypothetical protein
MAWIFSLSAECGPQKETAEAVANHFKGLIVTLADGSQFPCGAGVSYHGESWWAIVCPDGVSTSGIRHDQDQRQMTEIGFMLYERLRTAPPYRYALVGVEAAETRDSLQELGDDLEICDWSGLVLADSVWKNFGSPSRFVPFVHGYHWRPFVEAR